MQKTPPFRSSRYTAAAKGQCCVNCGREDGTNCARHYNGDYQHIYGKGYGQKCSDLATADLCDDCNVKFTEGSTKGFRDNADREEQFLHLCLLTIMRRVEQGVLKIG